METVHRLLFQCVVVFFFSILASTDKLTKEEEEIYKLQHDLERTAITQQLNQKVCEVSNV